MESVDDILERAVVARIPAIVKALPVDTTGRRIVEVEASSEAVDIQGDMILQSALMGSANSFVGSGHLDIDHLSELGHRLGIPDPASYVVGRPMAVEPRSNGRTFVRGEIARSHDGVFDPARNKYDMLWKSLTCEPPVVWYASVYGFPTDLDDCRGGACAPGGARRWLVKAFDWRSLAFTRNPVNTSLTSPARIVKARTYMLEMAKSLGTEPDFAAPLTSGPPVIPVPGDMREVWDGRSCAKCGVDATPTLMGYRDHFAKCVGHSSGMSDILAHATMYKRAMHDRVRALERLP